jgi:hypothetical protein
MRWVFSVCALADEPFKFKIGKGQVIKGWDLGVATMKPGEKVSSRRIALCLNRWLALQAILTCRQDYAYGARGRFVPSHVCCLNSAMAPGLCVPAARPRFLAVRR